jgi:hypothetical protein
MNAQFPHRSYEYQLILANGELDEARGADDREVFDCDCSEIIDVLAEGEQLILFEFGTAVQVWELEDGIPVCHDVEVTQA